MADAFPADRGIKIELNAVIVAIQDNAPQILIDPHLALPSGPFESGHRTLEQGLRAWARAKGSQPLGYVEQLYTFADKDRTTHLHKSRTREGGRQRVVSIGYLALVQAAPGSVDSMPKTSATWSPCYRHFPWEDHRMGPPPLIAKSIMPGLAAWKTAAPNDAARRDRAQRIQIAFPKDMRAWNEELVLQRYELLWEAGLVEEAAPALSKSRAKKIALGTAMAHDHRRILATAIARLRAKIKYRPVVFELLPDAFTLLQLQTTVEALAGLKLHKQNFRRLIEAQGLVEETGAMTSGAAGRPAKLFAFRREVQQERASAGTKLPRSS